MEYTVEYTAERGIYGGIYGGTWNIRWRVEYTVEYTWNTRWNVEYTWTRRGIYVGAWNMWIIRGICGGAPGRPWMAGCAAGDDYFHSEIDGGVWNIRWILQWNLLDPAMDSDYWIHQTT